MAQVDSMNAELEQTVEAWNYANIQLGKIDADLASNAKHLSAAKKSLVVAHGGEISATSEPGRGTEMRFTFPLSS